MYISSKLHDAMMKFGAYDFDNSSLFCVQFALDSSVHGLHLEFLAFKLFPFPTGVKCFSQPKIQ